MGQKLRNDLSYASSFVKICQRIRVTNQSINEKSTLYCQLFFFPFARPIKIFAAVI